MMKSKPSTVGNEKQQNIIRWNDDTSAFYPSPQCIAMLARLKKIAYRNIAIISFHFGSKTKRLFLFSPWLPMRQAEQLLRSCLHFIMYER